MDVFTQPFTWLHLLIAFVCGMALTALLRASRAPTSLTAADADRWLGPPRRFEDIDQQHRQDVMTAIASRRRIDAIKIVREQTGLDLKASKDVVDGLGR
jgi:ribosomal protein L7/L12